jgi:hypothetical protein
MHTMRQAVPVACLIGLIWGSTNPFIRRGSLAVEAAQQQQDGSSSSSSAKAWFIPALCLPWLCNQLGSVLFVVLLGQADISMAVPVANAISIAANALVSGPSCTPPPPPSGHGCIRLSTLLLMRVSCRSTCCWGSATG